MSRSKHPKCPNGRGCGVCGDKSEPKRRRENLCTLEEFDALMVELEIPVVCQACFDAPEPEDRNERLAPCTHLEAA